MNSFDLIRPFYFACQFEFYVDTRNHGNCYKAIFLGISK